MEKLIFKNFRALMIKASIHRKIDETLVLFMDKHVLRKILFGLIKNAMENTPDEGRIEINSYATDKDIVIAGKVSN